MTVIQKFSNSEHQQEKKRERVMTKKKELRINLLTSRIHICILNRIKRKIYKISSSFKAGVCWRILVEIESDKKSSSKRNLQIYYRVTNMNTKMRYKVPYSHKVW